MLSVSNMYKTFHKGDVNEVKALNGINIDVRDGDFVTIIGSNGAGKSTFLNAVAGSFFLDKGTITLAGNDVTKKREYQRAAFIGRVFQDPLSGTCASATIEQNMALALLRGKTRGLRKGVTNESRELFKERLATLGLGLEERLKDAAGLLSGGQRQAMTMLMATLVKPEVLLLDEHTAALDPKTASKILELTEKIVEEQKLTALMVTHNMNHAITMGNRLVMFHRGKIIMDIAGEEKKSLKVDDLLRRFYEVRGEEFVSDRALLA
ncbi:MAG: ABC transporter ATP-binding protein [Desulfovibrio sp.]